MKYFFDEGVAKDLGVEEAIMLANIEFWIKKNWANDRHFYDGKWWTYNSRRAFVKQFGFWTVDQVRRILDKLVDSGLLSVGNYNENKYDHTNWYSSNREDFILELQSSPQTAENTPKGGLKNVGNPENMAQPSVGLNPHIGKTKNPNHSDIKPYTAIDIAPNSQILENSDFLSNSKNSPSPDDLTYVPVNADGSDLPVRKTGGARRDRTATALQRHFGDLCQKQLGVAPIPDKAGYIRCLKAMSDGGLTEVQVRDLFEEWFSLGLPDEESASLTRALSNRQITAYKLRNNLNG